MDSKDEPTKQQGSSKFEQDAGGNVSLPREVLGFLKQNKKWWLLPILCTFLLVSILLMLSSTAAAPFIYTLF